MKLIVPSDLADITIKQYKLLAEIDLDANENNWVIEAVSILCKLKPEDVQRLPVSDLERIAKVIKRLNDPDQNEQPLQTIIDYKGVRYGFHPNLSKLTVGEFADVETYCKDGFFNNLTQVMSILYRPIKDEYGDFYSIEEYEGARLDNHWDDLKMNIVMGAVNFFLSIGLNFTKDLHSYSKAGAKI